MYAFYTLVTFLHSEVYISIIFHFEKKSELQDTYSKIVFCVYTQNIQKSIFYISQFSFLLCNFEFIYIKFKVYNILFSLPF